MVLPVGGFMPIPLALMIPFMATQSLVMGEAFGKAFQYGKRRISAMSNDEFNAYTTEAMASEMFKSYKNIIPELKESIAFSTDLQNYIMSKMIDMPRELIAAWLGMSGTQTESTPGSEYVPEPGRFTPPKPGTSGEPTPKVQTTYPKPTPVTQPKKLTKHSTFLVFQITGALRRRPTVSQLKTRALGMLRKANTTVTVRLVSLQLIKSERIPRNYKDMKYTVKVTFTLESFQ